MTMTLIETVTLASTASTIEFTSIPQDGADLIVLCSFRGTGAVGELNMQLTLNGNTGLNYAFRVLKGNGNTVVSTVNSPDDNINQRNITTTATDTANTFSNASIYIANYAAIAPTSVSSDIVTENFAFTAFQNLIAGSYSNSEAITTVRLTGTTLAIGSSASLYKIS